MQKILIVGGRQDVSAEMSKKLADSGHEVVAYEDLSLVEQAQVQVEIQRQDSGFGLEDHAWHLDQTLGRPDPSIGRALRNTQRRNQEALRPKTAQDLAAIGKAQDKQARKQRARDHSKARQGLQQYLRSTPKAALQAEWDKLADLAIDGPTLAEVIALSNTHPRP